MPVKVIRAGKELMFDMPLTAPPEDPPRDTCVLDGRQPLSGAGVANLSPAVADELGLVEWRPGVIVMEVQPGSFAGRFVRPGDMVLGVNGQDVKNVAELKKRIAAGVASVSIGREGMVSTVQFRLSRGCGAPCRLNSSPRSPRRRLPNGCGPKTLAEILGQDHLLGPEGPLGRMLAAPQARLADPVGTAGLRQDHDRAPAAPKPSTCISSRCRRCSPAWPTCAGSSRPPVSAARTARARLLFVDEIHRFNRAQQDGFLPYVEDGTVTLIGATTENPSFELNAALLSRCQVLVLRRLDDAALSILLARVEQVLARSCRSTRRGGRRCSPWPTATAAT